MNLAVTKIIPTSSSRAIGSFAMVAMGILILVQLPIVFCRKTMLTWVNGIAHTVGDMEKGKEFISELFGGKPVLYCYNPTAMAHEDDMFGYLADLSQAGTQKLGYFTDEVNSLVMHLRRAIEKVGRKGRVIHIAHSQGALITHLATKKLSKCEMNQMEILTFGGAAAVTKTTQTPFQRCVNYYSVNDPLLLVVPQATQALRSGFTAAFEEFCFLAPRMGDPIADHNLFGPTYAQALQWEGIRFQRLYEATFVRIARRLVLIITVLLETLSSLMKSFFQVLLHPLLVWCKLLYFLTFGVPRKAWR